MVKHENEIIEKIYLESLFSQSMSIEKNTGHGNSFSIKG
jgi:hypothetical protein